MRKWIISGLGLVLVAALIAAGLAWRARTLALAPFRGFSGDAVFVDVAPGASPRAIAARLIEAGVVRDATTFRVALWLTGQARDLKAGEYRFTDAAERRARSWTCWPAAPSTPSR